MADRQRRARRAGDDSAARDRGGWRGSGLLPGGSRPWLPELLGAALGAGASGGLGSARRHTTGVPAGNPDGGDARIGSAGAAGR